MHGICIQENCSTNLVLKLMHILQTKIDFFTCISQKMKKDFIT